MPGTDVRAADLLVVDPPTKVCVAMAGLDRPAAGYSGTWCSLPQLQAAAGVPWPQWKPVSGLPTEMVDRFQDDILAQQGIYLPYQHKDPTTPETRTLSPDEAAAALAREWLFQAMGEPLAVRAWKEIAWGRPLAARLASNPRTPNLNRELAELAELEKRLQASQGKLPDAAAKDLDLAVRQVKRRMLFQRLHNVLHAMPVKPRTSPPSQPDRVVWPGTGKDRKPVEPGVFFSADVCQGVPDLPRGMVKYLRVFQLDYKTYSTWKKTYRHSGPAVSIVQEEGYCVQCHQGKGPDEPNLAFRPGHGPFAEPYLTLVGSAAWGYSAPANRPGHGIAGAIPVESIAPTMNDPKALA